MASWANASSPAAEVRTEDASDPADDAARLARSAPMEGLPYRGMAMPVQQLGDMTPYEKNLDEIAALGADSVSIVVDTRQENGSSHANLPRPKAHAHR